MADPAADPLWFKDAVIYQLEVRTFHERDGDGVGDFRGLIGKLDDLAQLGVTALCLRSFCPSLPSEDASGTPDDFKAFLAEAHRRGLRVLTEMAADRTGDLEATIEACAAWLALGVDGLRLNADRPDSHDILRRLRVQFTDRVLLIAAGQWPDEAAAFFGASGGEASLVIHYALTPRLFLALAIEDRFPIIDILEQTPAIPPNAQWATFLRDHDPLTLEPLTDEERAELLRVYASDGHGIDRRLAPMLSHNRRAIELLNALLLSLPGTPMIFQGDESGDAEEGSPTSLLSWTRRMLAMRRRFRAFGRGSTEFLAPENSRVLAFVREHAGERVLVVANLSRFPQPVELDLARWRGLRPIEVFSRNLFPAIIDAPTLFTMGPHDCFWLSLEPEAALPATTFAAPVVEGPATWDHVVATLRNARFAEQVLPVWVQQRRWFGGKAHPLRSVAVLECVPLGTAATRCDAGRLAFLQANYFDIAPEIYLLPLQLATEGVPAENPQAIIARLAAPEGERVVFDALDDESFRSALFEIILHEKRVRADHGELVGVCGAALRADAAEIALPLASRALKAEQSNSAIVYDGRLFLKLYRKPELGENPDAELLRFLSERQKFAHVPAFCGAIEHRAPGTEPRVLALLVANVPNEGDAWTCTLAALDRFFERVRAEGSPAADPAAVEALAGDFPARARQLGERTAQMHLALAADASDPSFAPEPFTRRDQRSLYQSMRAGTRRMMQLLAKKLDGLPEKHRAEAATLLHLEAEILRRQSALLDSEVLATRTRHHGDYHLGQVLNTGSDFIIIDFEGEPARALSARRIKRSPLRDVAGMLRSFHYAAHTALSRQPSVRAEETPRLEAWADPWAQHIGRNYLEAYLVTAQGASFIPKDPEALALLLATHLLEKAAYEVCYELNNRPDWIFIPVRGIIRLLQDGPVP